MDHVPRTMKKHDLIRNAQAQIETRLNTVTLSLVRRSFQNLIRGSVKKKEKLLLAVVEKGALERLKTSEFFRSHTKGKEGTLLQHPDKSRLLLAYIRNSVLKSLEHASTASTALLDILRILSDGTSQVNEYLLKLLQETGCYNDCRIHGPPSWDSLGYLGYRCSCLRSPLEAAWGEALPSIGRSDSGSYFPIYTNNPCPQPENRKEDHDDDDQYQLKFQSNPRSVEDIIEDELGKYKTAIFENYRY